MRQGIGSPRTHLPFAILRVQPAVLAFTLLLILFNEKSSAQVLFGSMVGNVTDATGTAVPSATVKVTETSTNESRTVDTNDAGIYNVATLPAGTYQVISGSGCV